MSGPVGSSLNSPYPLGKGWDGGSALSGVAPPPPSPPRRGGAIEAKLDRL